MEKILKTNDVAELTGYSPETIRIYVRRGILKAHRRSSKADYRFKESDIREFMNEEKTVKYTVKI